MGDLSRVVKWPKYVTLQRKKSILLKRLKSPPAVNQFNYTIDKNQATLVVIPPDVDPLELVIWLPALCRKKEVPYCFIKGKARLGQLVHKKTASCVAVTAVKREDQAEFEKLCDNFNASFNENTDLRRRWGGGIMGLKSQHVTQKKERAKEIEEQKKMGMAIM